MVLGELGRTCRYTRVWYGSAVHQAQYSECNKEVGGYNTINTLKVFVILTSSMDYFENKISTLLKIFEFTNVFLISFDITWI